mgnify:CR=1 FL=1
MICCPMKSSPAGGADEGQSRVMTRQIGMSATTCSVSERGDVAPLPVGLRFSRTTDTPLSSRHTTALARSTTLHTAHPMHALLSSP